MKDFKFYKNIAFLLGVITTVLLLFASCKKEPITPGQYTLSVPPADTTTWMWQYQDGGTLPNWGSGGDNELVGTTWVITTIVSGFVTTHPNDTVRFVGNTSYTVNSNAVRNYNLTVNVGSTNKTLNMYYFYPFGGSHYSGEVGQYFVDDGILNLVEFTNIQNTTSKVKTIWVKQ